jgi:hypothetical protein
MRVRSSNRWVQPLLAALAALGLVAVGCSVGKLDDVEQPPIIGPSETGLSAQLVALPDILNADGVSQSVVQMILRDASGQPASGRAVLFCATTEAAAAVGTCVTDSNGSIHPQAGSTYVGPIQQGIVMATDRDGVANVVWVAGTDHPATIVIAVRPYGIDAARGFLRTVEIFQQ